MTTAMADTLTDAPADRPSQDDIPWSVNLAYGFGAIGTSIMMLTVSVFLPTMLVMVSGVSPAVAGFVFTAAKLFDMAVDIFIGGVSDRTVSRWGRRRPYLFAGAIVGGLSFTGLFVHLPFEGAGQIAAIAALLLIYNIGYSLFSVPYNAMPAEMTDDYHGRTKLQSYKTTFIAIGQLIAVSGAAAILEVFGGGERAYAIMGVSFGVIVLVSWLVTFFGTARAKQTTRGAAQTVNAFSDIVGALRNGPYLLLLSTKFLMLLSMSIGATTALMFFLMVTKNGFVDQVYTGVASNLAMLATVPFWLYISRRFGKRAAYGLSCLVLIAVLVSWLFAGEHESAFGVIIRGVITGFSSAGTVLCLQSMLPDAIENDWLTTGQRREGISASLYIAIDKLAFAVGPALTGLYLAWAGFIPSTGGRVVEQPEAVITALYVCKTIVPIALLLAGLLLLAFYRLSEADLAKARAEARSRAAAQG